MARPGPVLVVALALGAFPAVAAAEDNPACAKFEEPLEYNACLASHGPKANLGGAHGDGDAPAHASASRSPAATAHRTWLPQTRRHGRAHMEFEVR